MHTRPPYEITHICLDEHLTLPALQHQHGNYLVFWWKNVALGDLYLEPGQVLTAEAYLPAVQAAIAPAVQQYAAQGPAGSDWQQWLSPQNFARWAGWMDTTLAAWQPAAMPPQVPVTVIICTRNRGVQLRRCLQMLQALACKPAEIVVVDNAPTDNDTLEVTRDFAGVLYVRESRAGLDIARNTGITTAQSPVVAFVDDDVVVHPSCIYRIWETFQNPTTVAMTGLVIALKLQTEAQLIFERCWSFNRGYMDKTYTPRFLQTPAGHAPPVWEVGAGANMAFRRSLFEEIGYFDELLDAGAAGCSGDSEIWFRVLLHGHTIRYVPQAVVYHEHRAEMAGLKQQLFYYLRGHIAAALIQHPQMPQAGYARHAFWGKPKYYAYLVRAGLPFFRFRSRTLWAELKGIVAGIAYYYQHRNRPIKP